MYDFTDNVDLLRNQITSLKLQLSFALTNNLLPVRPHISHRILSLPFKLSERGPYLCHFLCFFMPMVKPFWYSFKCNTKWALLIVSVLWDHLCVVLCNDRWNVHLRTWRLVCIENECCWTGVNACKIFVCAYSKPLKAQSFVLDDCHFDKCLFSKGHIWFCWGKICI